MQKAKNIATKVGLASMAAMTVGVGAAMATVPSALQNGVNDAQPTNAPANLFGSGSIFQAIADTLIFVVGAVSVIMLIIGGLRYVLSSGNSSAVEGAKNTILYAIIGIVVAVLAFAAVHFVITQLGNATSG